MALQWTPLRLIMTGDAAIEHRHRSDILNDVKSRAVRTLDKGVQCNHPKIMDYEAADSGLGGSGDLATVTVVEINNSPPENNSPTFVNSTTFPLNNNDSTTTFNTSLSTVESSGAISDRNNSIIRRESIDRLHELDEVNNILSPPDTTDCATLPDTFLIKDDCERTKSNEGLDDIKEQQTSLVMLNNSAVQEKLKEFSCEKHEDSKCIVDCLACAIKCCECTIL